MLLDDLAPALIADAERLNYLEAKGVKAHRFVGPDGKSVRIMWPDDKAFRTAIDAAMDEERLAVQKECEDGS